MMCRIYLNKILPLLLIACFLPACGGGGGGDKDPDPVNPGPQPEILTGVFIDSPVAGLNYTTESQSGTTNGDGEYNYMAGEQISFFIGGILLGTISAGPVTTPIMLVDGATDASDPAVINIVRLLQTLDGDNDPVNGINISSSVHTAAADMSLDFGSPSFATDVQSLLDAVGGPGTQLVDSGTAQDHFNTSLKTNWGTMVWGTDCWNQLCE